MRRYVLLLSMTAAMLVAAIMVPGRAASTTARHTVLVTHVVTKPVPPRHHHRVTPKHKTVHSAAWLHIWHLRHLEHLAEMREHRPVLVLPQSDHDGHGGIGYANYYNCAGLEALWTSNGGNSGSAFMAAEIAMAESGGYTQAISPTDDWGLWQINRPSWGWMASLDPNTNARSAITISGNGGNWLPWTTYVTGAYIGRC